MEPDGGQFSLSLLLRDILMKYQSSVLLFTLLPNPCALVITLDFSKMFEQVWHILR